MKQRRKPRICKEMQEEKYLDGAKISQEWVSTQWLGILLVLLLVTAFIFNLSFCAYIGIPFSLVEFTVSDYFMTINTYISDLLIISFVCFIFLYGRHKYKGWELIIFSSFICISIILFSIVYYLFVYKTNYDIIVKTLSIHFMLVCMIVLCLKNDKYSLMIQVKDALAFLFLCCIIISYIPQLVFDDIVNSGVTLTTNSGEEYLVIRSMEKGCIAIKKTKDNQSNFLLQKKYFIYHTEAKGIVF